jgi:hypothetical protein
MRHDTISWRRHQPPPVASTLRAVRSLSAAGAWLWLVTAGADATAVEATGPKAITRVVLQGSVRKAHPLAPLVLLHDLPGLLVAPVTEVPRHG